MKKNSKKLSRIDLFLMVLLVVVGLLVRLYKINSPLADFHSWRQADTAAVARNFVKDGIDLFHPRFDDLSPNQSALGLENPNGWRMVEFPIYNALIAILVKAFSYIHLEIWGRLVTIFFSLINILLIYLIAFFYLSRWAAFFSSLVYSVFPFFVFFSRVILPETTALAFALASVTILVFLLNPEKQTIRKSSLFFLSAISALSLSLAILIKPTTFIYCFPILYLFLIKYKFKVFKNLWFYFYWFIALTPFLLWRLYINQYPEGIPPSLWLLTQVNTSEGLKTIFFRPAFFRWIFFERINNLIYGGFLTFFAILGLFARPRNSFYPVFFLSGLAYLFIFQGGNVQHEYYQTIIFPHLALLVGTGINEILTQKKVFLPFWLSLPIILLIFLFSYFFSFYKVKDFYSYPPELPQIAQIIKNLTQPSDKIITERMGDTTLLYLCERKGAPSIYKDPDELKKMGYRYLATFNQETTQKIKTEKKYPVIFENQYFTLFKL